MSDIDKVTVDDWPAAADGVDAVDDGSHGVLVKVHAVGVAEELVVPSCCPTPLHELVHTVCLVPVVDESQDRLHTHAASATSSGGGAAVNSWQIWGHFRCSSNSRFI